MTRTYFNLRLAMGLIALLLPAALWLGGRLVDHEPLRCSMSAYYYSPAMRNVFVGAMVAVGIFLYLHEGFDRKENWALNAAGAFAVGIALAPTDGHCRTIEPSLHGLCAALFFLSIAYVCLFRAPDTLPLIGDERARRRFRAAYRLLAVALVAAPGAAVALTWSARAAGRTGPNVFFAESAAVLVFGIYWLTKSREIERTDAHLLAGNETLRGMSRQRLVLVPSRSRDRRTSVS